MNQKLKLLEKIFLKHTSPDGNPVNTLQDIDNLKVLVWTLPKTGTSTLASSFQHSIDGTFFYKNTTHSHHELCWFKHISEELKDIGFSFELLIEFINSKGIKPLIIQSCRCPIERLMSGANHLGIKNCSDHIFNSLNPSTVYIDYLKKTFKGLWTHNYNKELGYGFHRGSKYDILYVTIESINKLPENIKLIQDLKEYHNLKIIDKNVRRGEEGYKKTKNTANLRLSDINFIYDIFSEPLNFFYNEEKILKMKDVIAKKFIKDF